MKTIYRQSKWLIFMSIFLTLILAAGNRSGSQENVKTVAGQRNASVISPVSFEHLLNFNFEHKQITKEQKAEWYKIAWHGQVIKYYAILNDLQAQVRKQAVVQKPARAPYKPAPATPAPIGGSYYALIDKYFTPKGLSAGLYYHIMMCESRGNPNAKNSSSSASGLFQILGGPFDPEANVSLASNMAASRGTQPWVSSRGCWG